MTTEAKIEANRANAQHSTGPRTEEGKAASSRNALKHGLTSFTVLLPTEDPAEYVRIATTLAADRERRLALRHSLRDQIRSGPLGQTDQFARDFYDLVARTVRPQG